MDVPCVPGCSQQCLHNFSARQSLPEVTGQLLSRVKVDIGRNTYWSPLIPFCLAWELPGKETWLSIIPAPTKPLGFEEYRNCEVSVGITVMFLWDSTKYCRVVTVRCYLCVPVTFRYDRLQQAVGVTSARNGFLLRLSTLTKMVAALRGSPHCRCRCTCWFQGLLVLVLGCRGIAIKDVQRFPRPETQDASWSTWSQEAQDVQCRLKSCKQTPLPIGSNHLSESWTSSICKPHALQDQVKSNKIDKRSVFHLILRRS